MLQRKRLTEASAARAGKVQPGEGSRKSFTVVSSPSTVEEAANRARWPRAHLLGVGVALVFALAARLPHFIATDFPLNDGGMFYTMSKDILDNGFALPDFTSYNQEAIPFAYPPMSFYLTAGLSRITGIDPLVLVRYLPLIANLLTVVAVAALARSLWGTGRVALTAPIIFALIPRSYEWMIMGGGITRSVGFAFAVICLSQAVRVYARPTIWNGLLCGGLAAATLASHIELGLFVLYSLFLLAALGSQRRLQALLLFPVLALLAVGLTAPWWVTVIQRHGLAPFDAASLTGGWASLGAALASLEQFAFPPRLFLALIGSVALLGAVAGVLRGDFFLPLWLAAVFAITPRSAPSEGTLPLSLMAALGFWKVLMPGLSAAVKEGDAPGPLSIARSFLGRPRGLPALRVGLSSLAVALLAGAVSFIWPSMQASYHALESVSPGDREAMDWVSHHTPPDASFLVLTSTWSWEEDRVGEWFPAITERRSVLTPQGAEWLPEALHARKVCLFEKVRDVATAGKTVDELDQWAAERGVLFSYIYVAKEENGPVSWNTLLSSARQSPNYRVLVDTASSAVLERRSSIQPRWAASGEFLAASDCQTLGSQPADTQRAFEDAYGAMAAKAWIDQHQQATGGGNAGLCGRLASLGLDTSACPGSRPATTGSNGSTEPVRARALPDP